MDSAKPNLPMTNVVIDYNQNNLLEFYSLI